MSTKARLPLRTVLAGLGVVIALGIGAITLQARQAMAPPPTADSCRGRAFAEIGGPFSLINQEGAAVTQRSYLGRPALLYFGFTYCPDICPFSLQTMAEALRAAGPKAGLIQPIFISLDPERDTPAALKAYVASNGFPVGLQGLTGTPDQVAAAAKAFRVGFRKVTPDGASDYLIDHTSIFYLLDSKGRLATFFGHGTPPDEMATCLKDLLAEGL
jgi:protein SCO1